jgi:hypothetical protein
LPALKAGETIMTPDEWQHRERFQGWQNNEEEWLACPVADSLLMRAMKLGASERKLRLFGCACCRLIWYNLVHPESKQAVEGAERYAYGLLSEESLDELAGPAWAVVKEAPRNRQAEYVEYLSAMTAAEVACADDYGGWPFWERLVDVPSSVLQIAGLQRFGLKEAAMEEVMCNQFRDIFGNPFRPVSVAPEWRTTIVTDLAKCIYEERAFSRLPILGDALEEAGCTSLELLAHCREPREHVLGCWALDLLLEKT